jgi:hypothetical protein
MKGEAAQFLRFACALLGVISAGWFLVVHAANPTGEGFPTDWTHHHVIFSQPASAEQAQRIAQDTRYWQQWYRQKIARTLHVTSDDGASGLLKLRRLSRKTKGFWSEDMGSGATVGAGDFPAKYSFTVTTASCSDYVVFNTGLAGGSTQSSIIAFNNIYSGCTGGPSVYWAYNTGGQVLTSAAISADGTQVAFVQTNAGVGSLVLLKYAASGGSYNGPAAISSVSSTAYRSCVAPCMTTLTLYDTSSVGINDTTSSVFPDYRNDAIYVGGASGWLFKFSGVFIGTPAEVTTGGFPLQVNATAGDALTSPVHDPQSGNVFVADSAGYLYEVSTTGGVTASVQLDQGRGFVAGPIVDATAGYVYIFSSNDLGTGCAGAACAGVFSFKISDFPTTFSEGLVGTPTTKGDATGNPLYESGFDSTYWNSTSATGNLYVCGATGAAPVLYQLPISAGTFGTSVAVATLTAAADHRACSPVTDIYNPNTSAGAGETVFFSVIDNGHPLACNGGGCAMSFVDLQWQKTTNYNVGQKVLVSNAGVLYTAVATIKGTSGAAPPIWPTTAGSTVGDGSVTWTSQGATTVTNTSWAANHNYALHDRIVVTVGTLIYYQAATTAGTSGATQPTTWNTTLDGTTTDNTVTWTNIGIPYSALASTDGTSGIIIDNIVSSGTLAGTSQVYFSTLGNQACTTSGGTGGCATQASQSALQ